MGSSWQRQVNVLSLAGGILAGSWLEKIETLYGSSGLQLIKRSIEQGAEIAECGYPVVLPPFTLDLIGSLALTLDALQTGELEPLAPPVSLIEVLDWNQDARWPFPKEPRSLADIHYLTVHHSGSTLRDQTSIQAWHSAHTHVKSWSRIGYHFAIASYVRGGAGEDSGEIGLYQLNEMSQVTWHDASNYRTLGLVMAGDFRSIGDGGPNDLQVDLWGRFTAWLLPQLPNLKGIVPHNHFQATECPGDWNRWVPKLVESSAEYGLDIRPLIYAPTRSTVRFLTLLAKSAFTAGQRELYESQKEV